jgi:hypothetical protein
MSAQRLMRQEELTPTEEKVCLLPGGWVLVSPTETELQILNLFALAIPTHIEAVCQEKPTSAVSYDQGAMPMQSRLLECPHCKTQSYKPASPGPYRCCSCNLKFE